MSSAPIVSVLMTAYNREKYIASSIESVLAQSFSNFELVIVDDGSSDRTVEIARTYEERDARVHVHVNERNLGQFPNRNHAATLARGELIKFHDSDDLLYPHCLSVMVPLLLAYPEASFALHPPIREWAGGPLPMLSTPRMSYQREFLGTGMFSVGPGCALFRRETFLRLGGFPSLGVASDTFFWLRACKTENVLLTPGGLWWYRWHEGQEFSSSSALREYMHAEAVIWKSLFAADCPLDGGELEQARRNRVWLVARFLLHDFTHGHWARAWLRLRLCGISAADWLRYFRGQRLNTFAGAPHGADGDFILPDWDVYKYRFEREQQKSVR